MAGIEQINVKNAKGILLWWGKLRFLYGYASFYIGLVSLIMLILTTYNTTVRDWAYQYMGWEMSLWQFVLIIVGIVTLGFILEYIISIPAMIAVSNEQMYKHDSPIKTDFDDIRKKQSELEKKIDSIIKLIEDKKQ